MSATELEDVQALLDRVLPDPRGFAGRLLQQAITQYGLLAEPAASAFYAAAEAVTPDEAIIVPDEWITEDKPVDITIVLAAALGACECWGLRDGCDLCDGQGSAGWAQPDPELFDAFVGPALERVPTALVRGRRRHDPSRANQDHDGHPTVQGENA